MAFFSSTQHRNTGSQSIIRQFRSQSTDCTIGLATLCSVNKF